MLMQAVMASYGQCTLAGGQGATAESSLQEVRVYNIARIEWPETARGELLPISRFVGTKPIIHFFAVVRRALTIVADDGQRSQVE
jgi:hypothetical protein